MANTVVLKRSAVPDKTPTTSDLALGELALNTYDGNLFFKKDSGTASIVSVATLTGTQTLTNKTLTSPVISGNITGDGAFTGYLKSLNSQGDEGGEILLAKPATNSTISGTGVTIDVYQNKIRFFEQGGNARGVYIDITAASAGVSTNLLTGGVAGVTSITAGTGLTGGTITSTGTIAIDSTVVTLTDTQTLTNKTISASNNTISGLTNSNLSGSAGISNANLANSSVTIGSTAISLGATATTIAGLSSVTSTSFVGSLTGNADTATTLQTSRTINGVSFDGSANITINAVDSTARIASSEKGAPNGVATLDSSGLVPSTQLPSYVDDVLEYSNLASFPATGETGKIYVALDTNKTYRWSGSAYIFITSGAVDSVAGKTGVVTLDKNDVGLNNVDNTADSAKSVSSAATLTTARNINGTSFNGSADITITAANPNALTIGTGLSGTSYSGASAVTIALASDYGDTQNPYASKTANFVLAAPNGSNGVPSFRALVAADIPTLNQNTTGSAATLTTGRTIALTGDVTYTSESFNGSANVTGTATLASVGTAGTYTKVTTDAKGRVTSGTTLAATDIPNLDAAKITTGTIDAARLPSYVDDVIEGANLAAFPVTGETGKIYVALDTNKTYRWSGSAYIFITSGAVDSVAGKTGVVTLDKNDVGLNNVDNTADSAKSVSSAATLTTARTINGVSFDGSANITVTANTTNALTIGTGLSGTSFNGSGAVTIALASDYGDTQNPYASKTANTFLAAPNGTAGAPTFRAIVAADIPTLNQNTTGTAGNVTGTVAVANGGTGQTSYTNGQLLIGNSTGNTLTKATLTAGAGITITNGAGSITIESTASGGGGGSTPWIFKTANYTASASDRIIATTTSGSFTITLPASPSAGDEVIIADGDNWQTNNLIINRNGSTIKGLAENLTMDLAGVKAEFVYSGSTWLVFAFASGADDTLAISLAIGDDF